MAYEILGETIKSAISIKLGELFDNPYRYKESVTNPKYPNFFISQIQTTVTPKGKDRLQLDYLINIRYRVASDTTLITNLHQQLDEIGLKLCSEFLEIDLELPVKTKNRYYEKDNGVLQFFCNITVFAKPETEEEDKVKNLKLNEEVI